MSHKRHAPLLILTGSVLIVAVLVAALYFSARGLLGSQWVRGKIAAELSRATGGAVTFSHLNIDISPRPQALFYDVKLTAPRTAVRAGEVAVEPEILPLLQGELRIKRIHFQQPQIAVILSEEETPFDPRKIESKLLPVFRVISTIAPDVRIEVREALLKLTNFTKTPVTRDGLATFSDLDLSLALSKTLVISGRCSDSPWGELALRGRFSYTPGILQVNQAEAVVSRSMMREFSGSLDWRGPILQLKAKVGRSDLSLGEIEVWSGRWLARTIPNLKQLGGNVLLSSAGVEGPMLKPADWRFSAAGLLRQIEVTTEPGPGPVRIASAAFEADDKVLSFEKAELATLDSMLQLTGRLRLNEQSLEAMSFSGVVGIKTLHWLSRYEPVLKDAVLPGKIKLNGRLIVRPGVLQITNMEAATGSSSLSGLSARIDWTGSAHLKADISRAVIVRQEFGLWGASELRKAIPELTSISGVFRLTSGHLEGPLENPEKWRYQAVGMIEHAAAGIRSLPAPVRVDAAEFNVDGNRIDLWKVRAGCLDTATTGSARFLFSEAYDLKGMDLVFDGSVGEKSIRWVHDNIELPDRIVVPKTLSVAAGRLNWQGSDSFSLRGIFKPRAGFSLTLDLNRTPDGFQLRDSGLLDELSKTAISLDYKRKGTATFNWSGTLHKKTVDTLYRLDLPEEAMLTGDLKGRIPLDAPQDMTATGRLQARNIRIPLGEAEPITVRSLVLKAEERKLTMESSELFWMGHPVVLSGEATAAQDKMTVDAAAKTDRIVFEELIDSILKVSGTDENSKSSLFSCMPVEGRIRVGADQFDYHKRAFKPFNADVLFGSKWTRVFVSGTRHCSLPVAGTVEIRPDGCLSFSFQSQSANQKAAPVLACLTGERAGITGTFGHRLELEGDENAPASLRGNGEFVLLNGRIYRFSLLSRILEFLNVTQLVMGDLPDIGRKGTLYNTIRVRYRIEGEEVLVDEIQLDGPTLRIAGEGTIHTGHNTMRLTLLVSPLRTVDKILGKIPVVKNFRNIIAIPVGVSGEVSDPKITPLAPSAIGTHLYELMKSVVRLPFTLINP